jgi:hypothetical protein
VSGRPGLAGTQDLFWALITAPEGVRPGLDDLVRRGLAGPGDLDAMIAPAGTMTPADRLDIYANMYFFRLLDCLKEDYPRLLEAIGAVRFHNLATDYLLECPSEHPSLRYVGARLPAFLRRHALGRECPALADLARLEWARADLFDAADAAPLTRAHLAALPQDEAGDVSLRLIPAFALLRLEHDAPRLWREMKDRDEAHKETSSVGAGAGCDDARDHADAAPACVHARAAAAPPLPASGRRATDVRVWRKGIVVYHRGIDPDEAAALEAIATGEPLGRIAQRLAAGRAAEQATMRFGRMLQSWIDDALLAAPAL